MFEKRKKKYGVIINNGFYKYDIFVIFCRNFVMFGNILKFYLYKLYLLFVCYM